MNGATHLALTGHCHVRWAAGSSSYGIKMGKVLSCLNRGLWSRRMNTEKWCGEKSVQTSILNRYSPMFSGSSSHLQTGSEVTRKHQFRSSAGAGRGNQHEIIDCQNRRGEKNIWKTFRKAESLCEVSKTIHISCRFISLTQKKKSSYILWCKISYQLGGERSVKAHIKGLALSSVSYLTSGWVLTGCSSEVKPVSEILPQKSHFLAFILRCQQKTVMKNRVLSSSHRCRQPSFWILWWGFTCVSWFSRCYSKQTKVWTSQTSAVCSFSVSNRNGGNFGKRSRSGEEQIRLEKCRRRGVGWAMEVTDRTQNQFAITRDTKGRNNADNNQWQ